MKFTLLGHQERALDMLRHSLAIGHKRPMIQSPTGSGKTVIGTAIVEGALRKGNPVLFTVPFLSLVDQTVERFAEQGIHSIGVMQGYHPATDADQPVQVASIQTLMRRNLPRAAIVMIDEAHRWFDFYGKWMAMPDWQNIPFIGLSATPWAKGLGKHYDDLLIPTTTKALISEGFLSPFRVFAPAHPDLTNVRTVAGDYHEGQLSVAMSQPVLIADTVSTWLRLGEDRPTLCFAVDRAHARKLADQFEAAGVPTGYVDMDTPSDERRRIGERLKHGQIKVVCNVYTLTTGVDWDVRCIILARPTKSETLFTQIIGRGLRTAAGKVDCLILDHSDTTLRLGFVDDIHHDRLDMSAHQKGSNSRKDRDTPLPKECSACSRLSHPASASAPPAVSSPSGNRPSKNGKAN
ncbi:DEAD/DEAH box helicase [Mesorhizobium sp. A556]